MKYVLNVSDASDKSPKTGAGDMARRFSDLLFDQLESPEPSSGYARIRWMTHCVRSGDRSELETFLARTARITVGEMSHNPLRQAQYTLVSAVALITSAAIEGGVLESEAYALSDAYIQKADSAAAANEIYALLLPAVRDFTEMVHASRGRMFSSVVVRCREYIADHLHYRIRLTELAAETALSPAYLSALYRQETGETLSAYILSQKLEAACNLLMQSDLSVQSIASFLAFSSHSHFSAAFQRKYGISPRVYRKAHRAAPPG